MTDNFSAFVKFMADHIKAGPKACHCAFCNDKVIEFYDTDVVEEVRKIIDPNLQRRPQNPGRDRGLPELVNRCSGKICP